MRNVSEIKILRKKYNLTQKDLAERSGVSQSLIAKIEAGKIDPSYTNAQKIFESLQNVEESKELKAKDIMHRGVVFAKTNDYVKEIIKIMKRRGISQLPVMASSKVVGVVTERIILREVFENSDHLDKLRVGEIMEEVPPIVSLKMGFKMLMELLQDYSLILVAEKGDIKGIISKADLLGKIK